MVELRLNDCKHFGGPWMGNVPTLYGDLDYFMAIWYNLWKFGIVCGHLVFFPSLVCLDQEKSGNPAAVWS
jgi:hypothetical protein